MKHALSIRRSSREFLPLCRIKAGLWMLLLSIGLFTMLVGSIRAQIGSESEGDPECEESGPSPGPCYHWLGAPVCGWVSNEPEEGCGSGHHWSSDLCACICDNAPPEGGCLDPYIWNGDTCSCECPILSCPASFDLIDCHCVCDVEGSKTQFCCNNEVHDIDKHTTTVNINPSGITNALNKIQDGIPKNVRAVDIRGPDFSIGFSYISHHECCQLVDTKLGEWDVSQFGGRVCSITATFPLPFGCFWELAGKISISVPTPITIKEACGDPVACTDFNGTGLVSLSVGAGVKEVAAIVLSGNASLNCGLEMCYLPSFDAHVKDTTFSLDVSISIFLFNSQIYKYGIYSR